MNLLRVYYFDVKRITKPTFFGIKDKFDMYKNEIEMLYSEYENGDISSEQLESELNTILDELIEIRKEQPQYSFGIKLIDTLINKILIILNKI